MVEEGDGERERERESGRERNRAREVAGQDRGKMEVGQAVERWWWGVKSTQQRDGKRRRQGRGGLERKGDGCKPVWRRTISLSLYFLVVTGHNHPVMQPII